VGVKADSGSKQEREINVKRSLFIATSADGYISTENGDVGWHENAGNSDTDTA